MTKASWGSFHVRDGIWYLDLSSFDISRFSKIPIMFNGAEVTNAYAKNQADVNKFNASEYNTIKNKFVIKP